MTDNPELIEKIQFYTLWAFRAFWLLHLIGTIGVFIIGIPIMRADILSLLTSAQIEALARVNFTPDGYVLYIIVADIIFSLVFYLVATLILWNISNNEHFWIAILAAFTLITFGVSQLSVLDFVQHDYDFVRGQYIMDTPLAWLGLINNTLVNCAMLCFWFTYPNGQFVPRRTALLTLIWAIINVAWAINHELPFNFYYSETFRETFILSVLFSIACYSIGILSQIYRWRKISSGDEKTQSRWIVFGFALLFLAGFLRHGPSGLFEVHGTSWLIGLPIISLLSFVWCISLLLAIRQHKLWDINKIIRRTLVYTSMTLILISIHLILSFALRGFFSVDDSFVELVVINIFLIIAINPIRNTLQTIITRSLNGKSSEQVVGDLLERPAHIAPDSLTDYLWTVVSSLASNMKLPYVTLTYRDSTGEAIDVVYGKVQVPVFSVDLCLRGKQVGEAHFGYRAFGEFFTHAERKTLQNVSHIISFTLAQIDLINQLNESNARLRQSTEELKESNETLSKHVISLNNAKHQILNRREEAWKELVGWVHDDVAGSLNEIHRMVSNSIEKKSSDDGESQLAQAIKTVLHKLDESIRNASHNLFSYPITIDQLGLTEALTQLIFEQRLPANGNYNCQIELASNLNQLEQEYKIIIYRIVNGAIHNIKRHAQANIIRVSVQFERVNRRQYPGELFTTRTILIQIMDDGTGFYADAPDTQATGIGMKLMQRSAGELDGSIIFGQSSFGGAQITAQIPIRKRKIATLETE